MFILAISTYNKTIMKLEGSKYRAMEGAVELEFCDEESGDMSGTINEQKEFLLKEGFSTEEVNAFAEMVKEM